MPDRDEEQKLFDEFEAGYYAHTLGQTREILRTSVERAGWDACEGGQTSVLHSFRAWQRDTALIARHEPQPDADGNILFA